MNTLIYVIFALVGAGFLLAVYKKSFKSKGTARNFAIGAGFVLLIYGLMGASIAQGWVSAPSGTEGIFLFTATGVASNAGNDVQVQQPVAGVQQRIINTLTATDVKEKYSNSYTTVDGTLRVFDAGTDPKSPTASQIDSITITNGVGSSTTGVLKTNTQYRVTFNGSNTYYDKDYGIVTIPEADFNPSTGTASFAIGEVIKVATIDDLMNESAVSGIVNGQSSNVVGTDELGGDDNGDNMTYDISVGDGQFYIQPTISFSGANTGVNSPVLCFEWDTTNQPEGNELSALTAQLISGTDFKIPSNLLSYWSTQECVSLGTVVEGGSSSTVKFIVTVDETNLASDDVWSFVVDDLSDVNGKDVTLNVGATKQKITMYAQA